ncbi:hypothetical protein BSAJGB5T_17675 [Bacillus safensis]|nr:hypothetical protein BSAJGB5T_17675 [Bacillus safensis]
MDFTNGKGDRKDLVLKSDPGYKAHCPECNWDGNCFTNISTGTAKKNAQQEANSHNKNTIHDSGNRTPATVVSCVGGID